MYNYSTNDNDDDIFDDSTSLSDSPKVNTSSKQFTEDTSDESSERIKDIIDSLLGKELEESFNFVTKVVIEFLNSASKWINSDRDEQFKKANYYYLDHLSAGSNKPFVYYEKYVNAQYQLFHRRIIHSFLEQVLNDPEKLYSFFKKVGIPSDSPFLDIYFGAFHNLNQFSMLECFAHYKSLAIHLNLPFNEAIMTSTEATMYVPQSYESFLTNQFSEKIIEDTELKATLSQVLSQTIHDFVNSSTKEDDEE